MKLLVMGAAGRLGRKVVEVAAERGHDVTAFARNPEALGVIDAGRSATRGDLARGPNVSPFPGDALQPARVAEAVGGHDAVVSALGRRGDEPTLTEGLRNLLTAMRRHDVRRIVVVGAQGVLDDPRGGLIRDRPEYPPFLERISAEHLAAFRELQASGLDWTMLCPPQMTEDAAGPVQLSAEHAPSLGTPRIRAPSAHASTPEAPSANMPSIGAPVGYRETAGAIIDIVERERFVGQRVAITPAQV